MVEVRFRLPLWLFFLSPLSIGLPNEEFAVVLALAIFRAIVEPLSLVRAFLLHLEAGRWSARFAIACKLLDMPSAVRVLEGTPQYHVPSVYSPRGLPMVTEDFFGVRNIVRLWAETKKWATRLPVMVLIQAACDVSWEELFR